MKQNGYLYNFIRIASDSFDAASDPDSHSDPDYDSSEICKVSIRKSTTVSRPVV